MIRENVLDIVSSALGKTSRPLETREVLQAIARNQVPQRWLEASFVTAHTTLSDYLVELGIRLNFWNDIVERHQANPASSLSSIPAFWLPAFSNPHAFLETLAQRRSRVEGVPVSAIGREWEVMTFASAGQPSEEPFSMYLSGLWLEGADWDPSAGLLVETTRRSRFVQFPVVRLTAVSLVANDPSKASNAGRYSPASSGKGSSDRRSPGPDLSRAAKGSRGQEPGIARDHGTLRPQAHSGSPGKGGRAGPATRVYNCPVYKSTGRLSRAGATDDQAPVCSLGLRTQVDPKLWAKRGVALVLERDYAGVNE